MSAVRSRQRPPNFLCLFSKINKVSNAAVVQLVRISACHAEGRGFESRPLRHFLDSLFKKMFVLTSMFILASLKRELIRKIKDFSLALGQSFALFIFVQGA